jgi:hypothetical protein
VLEDAETRVDGERLLAALAFTLENRRAVDKAALPLAALVEEVGRWVSSARDQSWVGRSGSGNRSSLLMEIEASERVVGPSLRVHVGNTLVNYVGAARHILARDHRHDEDVAAVAGTASSLTDRLSAPEGLSATWADVETAVRALDFFAAVEAVDQLEAQVDLAERDGKRVLEGVLGILRRNAWALWGGGEPPDDVGAPPDRDDAATAAVSMSADDVLDLARRSLVQPGQTGHVVVWSLYDRAVTSQGTTEIGPLRS